MAPPNRTRTRLARTQRRDQIVDAAAEVLRARDPAEVTFEEIADAAGVSRALLYNYFGDRQGLLEAVEQRHLDELEQRVAAAVAGAVTYGDVLAGCVRAHLDSVGKDPAGYRLLAARSLPAGVGATHAARTLGPALGGRSGLVRAGALAALQAMVLAAHEDGRHGDAATAAVITAFLAGALAGEQFVTAG